VAVSGMMPGVTAEFVLTAAELAGIKANNIKMKNNDTALNDLPQTMVISLL
jgi:hypothetical protein